MTAEPPTHNPRKSLRQSLKHLLRCRRLPTAIFGPRTIGSGILRKADPAAPLLPRISQVSLFPDFGSSVFDIEQCNVQLPAKTSSRASLSTISDLSARRSLPLSRPIAELLPGTRLSQFNLHQSFTITAATPRQPRYDVVPEALSQGVSRQASLASLYPEPRPRASTLKLQRSSIGLAQTSSPAPTPDPGQQPVPSAQKPRGLRQRSSRNTVLNPHKAATPQDKSTRIKPKPESNSSRGVGRNSGSAPPIKHFGSFCVLDTAAPGCPVTATSEDLRYIFDVGEQFFLHNQECAESSLDIVTGFDASGNEITHLVLFSPLVSPSSGRSRFMLAALIDITSFLQDTASLPELETISEESVVDEDLPTPRTRSSHQQIWRNPAYKLSAEGLLGGCFVDEEQTFSAPANRFSSTTDDIWLNLATEEKQVNSSTRSCRSAANSPVSFSSESTSTSRSSVVDSVLDDFMKSLQQLYSDFFLLAKSPLDDKFYEICNVSPSIYVSGDYVQGHLSHTRAVDIEKLSTRLGGDTSFNLKVRWGRMGQDKQLYCIPLFGQSSITWICVLVDIDLPMLW